MTKRVDKPNFIKTLDKLGYPTGSALHYNLQKKLGDYMKVLYEEPRRFYEAFISITHSEGVLHAIFSLLFEYLQEERGLRVDVNDFINALKNNDLHHIKLIMKSVEQASADILSESSNPNPH